MKGSKAAKITSQEDSLIILEMHWDIFWDIVETQGYNKDVYCIRCKALKRFEFKSINMVLACKTCRKTYSPTASTIFANSKIYLPVWLKAIYLLKDVNPVMTLNTLIKHLGCTNVTACNVRKKIRTINVNSMEYKLAQKYKDEIIKYI